MSTNQFINRLVAQYLQQLETPSLSIPDGPTLTNPTVQRAVYTRMFDESATWPLPPVHYRARVLKMILARIEESIVDPEEDEISDDLTETYSTLICTPKPSSIQQAQQLTYVTYTAPSPSPSPPLPHPDSDSTSDSNNNNPRTIITSESRGLILASGTTGFRTWEAALHLGTYLSTPAGAALVSGKRVLELGAGTGFLSMFCAKYLRPESVLATDMEPALIDGMVDSAGRNELGENFGAGIWEWGTELRRLGGGEDEEKPVFDLVVGADLIYDTDLIPLLINTLDDLFTNYKVQEFIIAATLRNEKTFNAFLVACQSAHFKTERLPFDSPAESDQSGFFHSTRIPISTYRVYR
ncbi:putative methyltransferase-domain-containing protein [Aspergillus taichungensis]|uniref:Putative methyltransferase-domain-containing protein n=1 Tax=Aspergillus taichungensis TaxID=482145 RepID=A0A2J5HT44_9EURO|nr:putative methyltransferase-domain-containing protein [Aspergillus taichungensis]